MTSEQIKALIEASMDKAGNPATPIEEAAVLMECIDELEKMLNNA